MITATRFHDISAGHRVVGHEGKCALLHGHSYRVHFTVEPFTKYSDKTKPLDGTEHGLDQVGRVLDFSVINSRLCMWLEEHWDHHMLLWVEDPLCKVISKYPSAGVVLVPFNPTAENMAIHLVETIGPPQLKGTGCNLCSVTIEETRKCSVTYTKGDANAVRQLVE